MKQEKTIVQAKLNVHLENSGVNSLQREIKALKAKIEEYKVKIRETTYYHDEIRAKYDELKIKTDMIMEKPATIDGSSQTEPMTGATFVEQMDWDRVNKRAESYKSQYYKVLDEYKAADENYKKMEAQYNKNTADLKDVNSRMNVLQWKYNQTKEICNNRLIVLNENEAKITEYEQNEARLKTELDALKQSLRQTPGNSVAYNQLKLQFNDLYEQHSKSTKKLEYAAKSMDNFKAKYAEMKAENESLKQQLTDIKKELDALNEECAGLRQSNEATECKLNKVSALLDRFKRANADLRVFETKYKKAKEFCEGRFKRIQYLQDELRRHGIPFDDYYEMPNDENVPINS